MVKWYNESLPRISREFDSPWPHIANILVKSTCKTGAFHMVVTVDKTVDRWIKDNPQFSSISVFYKGQCYN